MTVQETKASTPLREVDFEERDGCRVITHSIVTYEDGAEESVLQAVRSAADISSMSDELDHFAETWPERYHLSKSRANFLRPFALGKGMRVLDVGGGCGAIARYLGETCAEVDVLEPVPSRAAVARARTRDLGNVEVFIGDLDTVPDEPAYDVITVIGVLEYIGLGALSNDSRLEFLAALSRRLLPGGRIIIAIENRLGVKYMAGAPEDHSDRPFDGLEGYPSGGPARTFSRNELEQLLSEAGLDAHFYHAFPDYKLSRVIFQEDIFDLEAERSLAWRIPYFPSPDWTELREPGVNEESLWRSLVQSGTGKHFSNSFVVVASPDGNTPAEIWESGQLAAFYTTGRRSCFATETRVVREADGTSFQRALMRGPSQEAAPFGIALRVEESAQFIGGTPLLELLANADDAALQEWLARWSELVEANSAPGAIPLDLVPGNIIVDRSGAPHAIDQEWFREGDRTEEVLQRGVIWLAHHLTKLTPPDRWAGKTVADVALLLGSHVGLTAKQWFADALQREVEFQAVVHDRDPGDNDWKATVNEWSRRLQGLMDARVADGPLGPRRGYRGMFADAQDELSNTRQALAIARSDVNEAQERALTAERNMGRLETYLGEQTEYVHLLESQIRSITGSMGYRVVQRARRVVDWVAPPGSKRRVAVHVPKAAVAGIRREGPAWAVRRSTRVRSWPAMLKRLSAGQRSAVIEDIADQYGKWLRKHALNPASMQAIKTACQAFTVQPLISVVTPVYNPELSWLRDAIDSVRGQLYENWELCLADDCSTKPGVRDLLQHYAAEDPRIKVTLLEKNLGIGGASNKALALATGDFVGLLDHDDILKPDAMYEVVKLINENPEIDFMYSDEDKLSEDGRLIDPFFKPDWSPETFLSMNYVTHFAVYRKTLLDQIGGFRTGYDGSQDYDLALRASEKARAIGHVRKPIYTWRMVPGSAAASIDAKPYAYEAARRAIDDAMKRRGRDAHTMHGLFTGSYRVRYKLAPSVKVSIVIPTRDRADLLARCISSIEQKSTFKNYEITIIDNGSVEPSTLRFLEDFKGNVVPHPEPFNFSRLVNLGAARTDGEYILFLNNDTEVITEDWIEAMLEEAQKPEVGPVGANLVFPDGSAQHHGIVIGMAGPAANVDATHYFGFGRVVRNVSAVTAACMMVRREVFDAIGGFDEEMAVAYNDVDFCLRALEAGYHVVYTPFATLYHHESATRGTFSPSENSALFERRWLKDRSYSDPYYNPHLDLEMPYTLKL